MALRDLPALPDPLALRELLGPRGLQDRLERQDPLAHLDPLALRVTLEAVAQGAAAEEEHKETRDLQAPLAQRVLQELQVQLDLQVLPAITVPALMENGFIKPQELLQVLKTLLFQAARSRFQILQSFQAEHSFFRVRHPSFQLLALHYSVFINLRQTLQRSTASPPLIKFRPMGSTTTGL
jgi:hypothetical protein